MEQSRSALPADPTLSPAVRATYESYADQGGLLGAFTYGAVVLEADDDALAATLASIPTSLFVASSLHDDAIDKADGWDERDRKRRLNEHVTLGDLAFLEVVEAARSLPKEVDLGPVLETVRRIGRGQLREEALEPETATLEDAITRVDDRGAVWGDLAVTLVGAVDGYSDAQLEAFRRIATNGMAILTVVDDVEDLPADVDNGVVSVPTALCDRDLRALARERERDSTAAVADAFLESDAPERLEAMLADRWAALEGAAVEFAETIHRSDEAVLEAVFRALSWYCESVCSMPVETTVPPDRQRALRAQLTGNERTKRRAVEEAVDGLALEVQFDREALAETVVDLPGESLADVLVMATHVSTVADGVMSTSLEDALTALERAAETERSQG